MTHCEALLDLLAPGRWVSTHDILRAEPMMVHSRVSDLRARGYEVEHRTVGVGARGHEYRLVGALEGEAVLREPSSASPSSALIAGETDPEQGPSLGGTSLSLEDSHRSPAMSALTEREEKGQATSGSRSAFDSRARSLSVSALTGEGATASVSRVGDSAETSSWASADISGSPVPSPVSALAGREAQPDTEGLTLSHPDIPAGTSSEHDEGGRCDNHHSRPAGALAGQLVLTGAPFRREPRS